MSTIEIQDPASKTFFPLFGAHTFGYYAIGSGVLTFRMDWTAGEADLGEKLLLDCIRLRNPLHLRYRAAEYRAQIEVATGLGTAEGVISAIHACPIAGKAG